MAEEEATTTSYNPYIGSDLLSAITAYHPDSNSDYEEQHAVIKPKKVKKKKKKKKKIDNDRNYRDVFNPYYNYSPDEAEEEDEEDDDSSDDENEYRELRGNVENTEKLVTARMRHYKKELGLKHIPKCIIVLCFQFSFIPTNVLFDLYDPRVSGYIDISKKGKKCIISSRTIFIFSKDGYDSGRHTWHVRCDRVYTCQALGISEFKNPKYRYGDNIFDVALNDQLGDRYIYAGDRGHSWRGSNDLRPYVCSVLEKEEYYSKRLKLDNSCWEGGDIITVDLDLGSGKDTDNTRRTITFYKNGKKLHRPITVEKQCIYYPVFQVYQRGTFEIIDDIKSYGIEFESSDDEDDDPAAKGMDRPDLPELPQIMIRTKSLDSDDSD